MKKVNGKEEGIKGEKCQRDCDTVRIKQANYEKEFAQS